MTERHSPQTVEEVTEEIKEQLNHYVIKCPCCGTVLWFGKEDVYKDEDEMFIHHEYIKCPECSEEIQLDDEYYFGY